MIMKIQTGDFDNPQVFDLLRIHLESMHENSPPGSVYALDLSGLQVANIDFFTVWNSGALMGCGALKEVNNEVGEIKSMRTHPEYLRKGVAAFLLEHIIQTAKKRAYKTLSLETGSGPAFEPAIKLYLQYGFTSGAAFGDYTQSEFNQFFHLNL